MGREPNAVTNNISNKTIARKNASCSLVQMGLDERTGDYSAGGGQMKEGVFPRSPFDDQTSTLKRPCR
jgi:hypothetical protein